jgi:hypothetical protein
MQSIAEDKEWGIKSIKQRRSDDHGNIEFLVELDGNWINTWEPQEVLKNAQVAINEFMRAGSTGNAARRSRRAAQDDE